MNRCDYAEGVDGAIRKTGGDTTYCNLLHFPLTGVSLKTANSGQDPIGGTWSRL